MDELSFQLLAKFGESSPITYEELIDFHANSAALGHYRWDEFSEQLRSLQLADLVLQGTGPKIPYSITPKGKEVLEHETKKREIDKTRDDFQKELEHSAFNANQSVIATNLSVQKTNDWMTKNAKRQNWLTIGNMTISFAALAIAGVSLFQSCQDKRREREQAENKRQMERLQILDHFLKHPDPHTADSVLLELIKE
jgi:hypothetical protein